MQQCQIHIQFCAHLIELHSNQTNCYAPRSLATLPLWSANLLPPLRSIFQASCPLGEKCELLGQVILSEQHQIKIGKKGEICHMFGWVSRHINEIDHSLVVCAVWSWGWRQRWRSVPWDLLRKARTHPWMRHPRKKILGKSSAGKDCTPCSYNSLCYHGKRCSERVDHVPAHNNTGGDWSTNH